MRPSELADTVSGKTLDDEKNIKPWIQAMVTAGKLPVPTADTLYAIYYPQSTTITLDQDTSCSSFGAFHGSATVTVGGQTIEARSRSCRTAAAERRTARATSSSKRRPIRIP